jgi:dTDP-4-amino-4,6-dideoxygalactose transaminase
MMIPRYLPALDLGARRQARREMRADAPGALAAALVPGQIFPGRLPVAALRDGLNAWFRALAQSTGTGAVVMSAQICPLVPLAVRHAGLVPRFVDIGPGAPVPSGEQFAVALDASARAVVMAPFYGHAGAAPEALIEALGDRPLLLDLAQGLGLRGIEPLLARADAVGFSFGIGKGLDTGGGLLLTRKPLEPSAPKHTSLGIGVPGRAALLRSIVACGMYGFVARAVERAAEAAPEDFDPQVRVLDEPWVFSWWQARLQAFLREIEIARGRATALKMHLGRHPALAYTEDCFAPHATHLRQILRLSDPASRPRVLERLRGGGVDSAPAGEPLPSSYLPGETGTYPASAAFRADAIRLPFLGRLTEAQFARLTGALERALG